MCAVRVAVYARFSSDLQKATSLDDQLTVARRCADEHGWAVLDAHIYTDAAVSGASLDRPGIRALRSAVERRPLPFDILLVDDSSRISRDLADAVRLLQELTFNGVRVIYISQSIDSANEQAETMIAVHGVVDSLYLKEMSKKIKRGLAGQLERGFATGGITYGYRTVPVPDPSGARDVNGYPILAGKRVEVVPAEARAIVDICEWFANGLGTARLVERLIASGHPPPRGGRWRSGAVKRILDNEKYVGQLIWGRKTADRRPGTREYVARAMPRESWRIQQRPELRIVSDDLWARVQARRSTVRAALPDQTRHTLMRGRDAALYSPHLFSGFMTCGVCGRSVAVVTGGKGSPRYGCRRSWADGVGVCTNRLTSRAKVVDAHLLAALQRELLAPQTVQYVTDALGRALSERISKRPQLLADAERERHDAQQRLQRLVDAIEHGVSATSVAPAIAERQATLARLDTTIADLAMSQPEQRLAVMPGWVRQQLEDLSALLSATPERTKAEFHRLGLRVTMHPQRTDAGSVYYRAAVESALPFLAGIADMRESRPSAVDRSLPRTAGSRTLAFSVDLPANIVGPGQRKRA